MRRFSVEELPLDGLKCITRTRSVDSRGFLDKIFSADELLEVGWKTKICQVNHSYTEKKGTIRGMHYQRPPAAEMKLVSCIRGEVWDVAVDIRKNSPTFLNWHAQKLSSKNCSALLVPEGFAHGFQSLSDNTELIYCHSEEYSPDEDCGLNPFDPMLHIAWPESVTEVSHRDKSHALLDVDFAGLDL